MIAITFLSSLSLKTALIWLSSFTFKLIIISLLIDGGRGERPMSIDKNELRTVPVSCQDIYSERKNYNNNIIM